MTPNGNNLYKYLVYCDDVVRCEIEYTRQDDRGVF